MGADQEGAGLVTSLNGRQPPRINKRLYCSCGSTASASSTPPDVARGILAYWERWHTGPGHERCDAATAQRARAKALTDTERDS